MLGLNPLTKAVSGRQCLVLVTVRGTVLHGGEAEAAAPHSAKMESQIPSSTYTVQGPSQEMVPPTVGGAFHLNKVNMTTTPPRLPPPNFAPSCVRFYQVNN